MIAATPPAPPPLPVAEARAAIRRYQARQHHAGHVTRWRFLHRPAERVTARRVRLWVDTTSGPLIIGHKRTTERWTARLEVRRHGAGVRVEWLLRPA